MFNLSDVLKFVIDRLNQSPFTKHNLVGNGQQGVSHVILDFGYQLNSIHEQKLKQSLSDISFVPAEFPLDVFDKRLRVKRFTVVYIAGSEHEVEYLSPVIDDQVQLKAEKPAHRALATFSYTFESLMYKYTLMLADP